MSVKADDQPPQLFYIPKASLSPKGSSVPRTSPSMFNTNGTTPKKHSLLDQRRPKVDYIANYGN